MRIRTFVRAMTVLALVLGPLQHVALGDTTKGLLDCQKSLDKEAVKLVKVRTKYLGQCVEGLLACQLAIEVDGAPIEPCRSSATAACNALNARISDAELKFNTKVGLKCGVSDGGFRSRRGLGFRDDGDACAALTPPAFTFSTAQGLLCAVRAADCAADDDANNNVLAAARVPHAQHAVAP